jgi:branched-chain amino acid transport system permease protein
MTQVLLFNIVNGLIVGAFYVLMALGLSLILNLSGVINFAHGGSRTCDAGAEAAAGSGRCPQPPGL